jgi:hypothetical protein
VRRVGHEPPLCVERAVQPLQHGVERRRQRVHLVGWPVERDALTEAAGGGGDMPCGVGHLVQPPQLATAEPPARTGCHDTDHEKRGQPVQQQRFERLGLLPLV